MRRGPCEVVALGAQLLRASSSGGTRFVEDGLVALFQENEKVNGKQNAVKHETNNREIGGFCVLAGIYEDVRRLVHDLKLVFRICGHERAVVWQVRLVPVKR